MAFLVKDSWRFRSICHTSTNDPGRRNSRRANTRCPFVVLNASSNVSNFFMWNELCIKCKVFFRDDFRDRRTNLFFVFLMLKTKLMKYYRINVQEGSILAQASGISLSEDSRLLSPSFFAWLMCFCHKRIRDSILSPIKVYPFTENWLFVAETWRDGNGKWCFKWL